jgi:hypothetical protein
MFQNSAPTTEPEAPPSPSPTKEPLPVLPPQPTRQPLPTPIAPPREDPSPIVPAPGWCPLRQNYDHELGELTCEHGKGFSLFLRSYID